MNHPLGKAFRHLDIQPAMTFQEIDKALGMTRGSAWSHYTSAIEKLKRRPGKLRRLLDLAKSKDFAEL
jgi:hypothetical protein